MIRYKLTIEPNRVVYVRLEADHADQFAPVEIEGSGYPVELVKEHLKYCHGIDGHLIEEETTPLDLAIAMTSYRMKPFSPVLEVGEEILKTTARKGLP